MHRAIVSTLVLVGLACTSGQSTDTPSGHPTAALDDARLRAADADRGNWLLHGRTTSDVRARWSRSPAARSVDRQAALKKPCWLPGFTSCRSSIRASVGQWVENGFDCCVVEKGCACRKGARNAVAAARAQPIRKTRQLVNSRSMHR